MFFDALLATAQQVHDERRHKVEGAEAKAFLSGVSTESAFTFALLADAGLESNSLTRFMDAEDFDKSSMHEQVTGFLDKICYLFGPERGALKSGCTQHMAGLLGRPRTIFIDNTPHTLGGPGCLTEDIINRCMQRLFNWVCLARHVIQAEFPGFETLGAFAALNLATNTRREDPPARFAEHVQRLAALSNVDSGCLNKQLHDLKAIAARHYQSCQCTTLEAWAHAVSRTTRVRSSTAEAHPSDALRAVLIRFAALGGSTSGVERLFALGHVSSGYCRTSLTESAINDELTLLCDQDPAADDDLIKLARKEWVGMYGRTRTSKRPERIDAGVLRGFKTDQDGKVSLAAWQRKRSRDVADAANSGPLAGKRFKAIPQSRVVGQGGWTETHAEEAKFQERKRLITFLESVSSGMSLPSETTAGVERAASLLEQHSCKVEAQYNKARAKADTMIAGPVKVNLKGARVYLDKALDIDPKKGKASVKAFGMNETQDRLAASVYVVADVTNPGQRNAWCLAVGWGARHDPRVPLHPW